jgi:hypothetical protein
VLGNFLSVLFKLLGARVKCTSTQTKVLLDHSLGSLCMDYWIGSFSSFPYPPLKKVMGNFMHGLVHGHHVIKWMRNAFVGCALGLGT